VVPNLKLIRLDSLKRREGVVSLSEKIKKCGLDPFHPSSHFNLKTSSQLKFTCKLCTITNHEDLDHRTRESLVCFVNSIGHT